MHISLSSSLCFQATGITSPVFVLMSGTSGHPSSFSADELRLLTLSGLENTTQPALTVHIGADGRSHYSPPSELSYRLSDKDNPKKPGFFSKLFGKKPKEQPTQPRPQPPLPVRQRPQIPQQVSYQVTLQRQAIKGDWNALAQYLAILPPDRALSSSMRRTISQLPMRALHSTIGNYDVLSTSSSLQHLARLGHWDALGILLQTAEYFPHLTRLTQQVHSIPLMHLIDAYYEDPNSASQHLDILERLSRLGHPEAFECLKGIGDSGSTHAVEARSITTYLSDILALAEETIDYERLADEARYVQSAFNRVETLAQEGHVRAIRILEQLAHKHHVEHAISSLANLLNNSNQMTRQEALMSLSRLKYFQHGLASTFLFRACYDPTLHMEIRGIADNVSAGEAQWGARDILREFEKSNRTKAWNYERRRQFQYSEPVRRKNLYEMELQELLAAAMGSSIRTQSAFDELIKRALNIHEIEMSIRAFEMIATALERNQRLSVSKMQVKPIYRALIQHHHSDRNINDEMSSTERSQRINASKDRIFTANNWTPGWR